MRAGMIATTFIAIGGGADYSRTARMSAGKHLTLQQIDGLAHGGDAGVLGHRGVSRRNFLVHCVGDVAVGEVSGGSGTKLTDVERLGKIHFEEGATAVSHGENVKRVGGSAF